MLYKYFATKAMKVRRFHSIIRRLQCVNIAYLMYNLIFINCILLYYDGLNCRSCCHSDLKSCYVFVASRYDNFRFERKPLQINNIWSLNRCTNYLLYNIIVTCVHTLQDGALLQNQLIHQLVGRQVPNYIMFFVSPNRNSTHRRMDRCTKC